MIASPHIFAGAAIGTAVEKFFPEKPKSLKISAAFMIGVMSHLLMDAIPHSEIYSGYFFLSFWEILIFELSLVFFCVFKFVFSKPYRNFNNLVIFSGVLGAMILDVLKLFTDVFQMKLWGLNLINQFHVFIHSRQTISFWPGFIYQILLSVAFFFVIKYIKTRQ